MKNDQKKKKRPIEPPLNNKANRPKQLHIDLKTILNRNQLFDFATVAESKWNGIDKENTTVMFVVRCVVEVKRFVLFNQIYLH